LQAPPELQDLLRARAKRSKFERTFKYEALVSEVYVRSGFRFERFRAAFNFGPWP
jgi:hypothetical protein